MKESNEKFLSALPKINGGAKIFKPDKLLNTNEGVLH